MTDADEVTPKRKILTSLEGDAAESIIEAGAIAIEGPTLGAMLVRLVLTREAGEGGPLTITGTTFEVVGTPEEGSELEAVLPGGVFLPPPTRELMLFPCPLVYFPF